MLFRSAKCKVPWHGDMSCEKFQRLGKDETWQENLILEKLRKKYPRCGMYVDKIGECKFVQCWYEFLSIPLKNIWFLVVMCDIFFLVVLIWKLQMVLLLSHSVILYVSVASDIICKL